MFVVLILTGLAALVGGAELLIRGAASLTKSFGLSRLVIGLTVVAFGTSTPELAVSVSSALSGQAEIALGNVVGSNIFNVLLILGVSALIVPLIVQHQLVRFDIPLMIAVSLLVFWMSSNGMVSRGEGFILCLGLVGYTVKSLIAGCRNPQADAPVDSARPDQVAMPVPEWGFTPVRSWKSIVIQAFFICIGLVFLVSGSNWFVDGTTQLAKQLGVSDLVVGLTVVACGTSLPEVATSVVAAIRGEQDIAVGNVIGSNIFNLLGVLGAAAFVSPTGVSVADQAMQYDMPIMIVVAIACLPVVFSNLDVSRREGAAFVICFAAYLLFLIVRA